MGFYIQKINDWEGVGEPELLAQVGNFLGTNAEDDTIRWKHHNEGVFSVNSAYKRGLYELSGSSTGTWKSVWKNMAPHKVKCFSWLVVRRACLPLEVLHEKKDTNCI